jgi:hypothetical protein
MSCIPFLSEFRKPSELSRYAAPHFVRVDRWNRLGMDSIVLK